MINDEDSLEEILNKKILKNLEGAGIIPLTEDIEDHLCSFIKQCNSLEIKLVLQKSLMKLYIKLEPELKKKTYKEHIDKFFKILFEVRNKSNIMDQLDLIGSMDETQIC